MSKRCPNCHADIYGTTCPSCGYKPSPSWICPECGTEYFTVSPFKFCPACRAAKDKLEQEYWDRKRDGMRSIANDIVSQILAKSA